MVDFTSRRDAFERKFAHDENLRFKAEARRNRLFGLWAAERLEKSGETAEAYARSVVAAAVERPGADAIPTRVARDLEAAGFAVDESEIRSEFDRVSEQAFHDAASEALV